VIDLKEKMTQAEADLIAYLEKSRGRKLTAEEINLSLKQARALGELD
jgi:hypothetical protein